MSFLKKAIDGLSSLFSAKPIRLDAEEAQLKAAVVETKGVESTAEVAKPIVKKAPAKKAAVPKAEKPATKKAPAKKKPTLKVEK